MSFTINTTSLMLTIKLKEISTYVSVKKANVSFVLMSQKYVP